VNKYRVAPKEERTFRGRVYASKAEMLRSMELNLLMDNGQIAILTYQPRFHLGCKENTYVADFQIEDDEHRTWVEDVKGCETRKFRHDVKLWRAYGPCPLHILKRRGAGWKKTIIQPGRVPE
jgi:hypothetical protein